MCATTVVATLVMAITVAGITVVGIMVVGHGVSLLRWRSGGVEHPHDTPPYPFMPSPTFVHSSHPCILNPSMKHMRLWSFCFVLLVLTSTANAEICDIRSAPRTELAGRSFYMELPGGRAVL